MLAGSKALCGGDGSSYATKHSQADFSALHTHSDRHTTHVKGSVHSIRVDACVAGSDMLTEVAVPRLDATKL